MHEDDRFSYGMIGFVIAVVLYLAWQLWLR
jgi:hypothetical protein